MRKCRSLAPYASSRDWQLHELQEYETVTHRPRSGSPLISNEGVASIENAF